MKSDYPAYLKLHIGDEVAVAAKEPVFELDGLCAAFSSATGVQLDHVERGELPSDALWSTHVVGPPGRGSLTLAVRESHKNGKQIDALAETDGLAAATELARELAQLVDQLHRSERALWEREGELAAAIPVVANPDEENDKLAARLQAILKGGAEAVDWDAAAMYLLDDATSQLKLRSHWGLSGSRFFEPARPLRSAKGDLEALAGHAVVLEDAASLLHWNIPESFASAACLPVSTSTFPLGTLWLFSETRRDLNQRESNLLEIVAGRIAVELEREILLRENSLRTYDGFLSEAIHWQQGLLPKIAPDVSGWDVAGCPSYESSLSGDWYHWSIGPKGRLHWSICSSSASGIEAALTASLAAGSLHSCYETDPVQALRRVNRVLWTGSAGGQLASAACGQIDPETGRCGLSTAGVIEVFIIRPHGWELVTRPTSLAGNDDEIFPHVASEVLERGDVMLVMAGQRGAKPRVVRGGEPDAGIYAETLLRHNHLSVGSMTKLLREMWDVDHSAWPTPPTILVAKYLD